MKTIDIFNLSKYLRRPGDNKLARIGHVNSVIDTVNGKIDAPANSQTGDTLVYQSGSWVAGASAGGSDYTETIVNIGEPQITGLSDLSYMQIWDKTGLLPETTYISHYDVFWNAGTTPYELPVGASIAKLFLYDDNNYSAVCDLSTPFSLNIRIDATTIVPIGLGDLYAANKIGTLGILKLVMVYLENDGTTVVPVNDFVTGGDGSLTLKIYHKQIS